MQDSGRSGALDLLMHIYLNPVNEPRTKVQEVRISICRDAYGTLLQAEASGTFLYLREMLCAVCKV